MKKSTIIKSIFLLGLTCLHACSKPPKTPENYTEIQEKALIYPDYKDVVVPPNIAPLNFILKDSLSTEAVALLEGDDGTTLTAAGKEVIRMDTTEWRALLQANRGKDIKVYVFAHHKEGWKRYAPHTITVAEEEIDPFLSYRLIEPGYELYRQIGLYQRNLTNWTQATIYENNREFNDSVNHCVNCHNYQNYSTKNMLFHVRSNYGGTMIVEDGKPHKVTIKDSTIITSAVYPSWHPTEHLVAFSTNKTGQTFHLYHSEKIEVMDESSDLLLYDVDRNEVSHILRTAVDLETFPHWAPDGRTLYYCNARLGYMLTEDMPDSVRNNLLASHYNSLHYDLMAMDFDPETRQFGQPYMVVNADSLGRSISVPRVSPDGRYILYTQALYGQFHIWHISSDLWVKDLADGSTYPLKEANSDDVDSYHSWSSNGRWIAFSSRRMDGNYTRIFLAYFDKHGKAHKAFVIPQEDPEYNVLLLKSFNVPELTKDAVRSKESELRDCIYHTKGDLAKYRINQP